MKINSTCPLVLKDLYFYDIRSCYYQLANAIYYDMQDINKDDKIQRNIRIGTEQASNLNFQTYLYETSSSIIDYYLLVNNVQEDEIILRQTDGFILTKILKDNTSSFKLDFRERLNFMVISIDRNMYLAVSNTQVIVKGVPNKYDELDRIYSKFKGLDFYNKNVLFRQLDSIRKFTVTNEDLNLYIISRDGKKIVITKKYGIIELSDNNVKLSVKNIDRHKYYELYVKKFVDSIILHFY